MKCYVTIGDCEKVVFFGSEDGIKSVLNALCGNYTLTHVDIVDDKKESKNE